MTDTDSKRNFIVRDATGEETTVFEGANPRDAAMKAARRLDPAPSQEEATTEIIRLRERGTDKVHVYKAKAWTEQTSPESPHWLGEEVTKANVAKEGATYVNQ